MLVQKRYSSNEQMRPTLKRMLKDSEVPVLISDGEGNTPKLVEINSPEFVIGRSITASLNITNVTISRTHCSLKYSEGNWLLSDESSFGTYVNDVIVGKGNVIQLKSGDKIRLGPTKLFIYTFNTEVAQETGLECKKSKIQRKKSVDETRIACEEQECKFGSKVTEKLQLEEKLKCVQRTQSHLKDVKVEMENSFSEQLVALKERHNLQREKFSSRCIAINANDEQESIALEQQQYNEQKEFEAKHNVELDDLHRKIVESKRAENKLMEQNKRLLCTLEQEREEFRKRLEIEDRQLQEKDELERLASAQKEQAQNDLLREKKLLEKKLKVMESLLAEKEVAQEEMKKKLIEKEEERKRDLKQLQEQKDAQTKTFLQEVNVREQTLRQNLESKILFLQEEKKKIEDTIRGELFKLEGESVENLKLLREELQTVKSDLNNTEGKKKFLERELQQTNKAKEDASLASSKTRQEVLHNFGELMENELQCSVCSELFVLATTLNCMHTFCQFCITEWNKKKRDCPVCRTPIETETRSIVLDSFIDRMVASLTEEMKHRRQELIEERQVIALLNVPESSDKSEGSRRSTQTASTGHVTSTSNSETDPSSISEPIYISSDSELNSSSNFDGSSSSSSVEGVDGEYYGGYGHCFRCGRRGHWARGCPEGW